MKNLFFILFFIINYQFLITEGYSQPVQQEWIRFYPQFGSNFTAGSIFTVLDNVSNIYVGGGRSLPGGSGSGYCIVKYSSQGEQQWVSSFFGPLNVTYSKAMAIDSSSNIYITGYSNNPSSYFDFCTIKYKSNGVQQWVKYYDDTIHGEDEAEKIAVDKAGNVYVAGYTQSGNSYPFTMLKYSPTGDLIWGKTDISIGSVKINDISIDDSCHVILCGWWGTKSITLKYDSSGIQLWKKTYSLLQGTGNTGANSLAIDYNNDIYITGFSWGIQTHSDYFTIKYSATGNQQWVRRYNQDSSNINSDFESAKIVLDDLLNIYITGIGRSSVQGGKFSVFTIKYSNDGDILWVKNDTTISNYYDNVDLKIDKFSNIYVEGFISNVNNTYSLATLKYDSSGLTNWIQSIVLASQNGPRALLLDPSLNVYVIGDGNKMCLIKYSQAIGIKKIQNNIPNKFSLSQNFPNPFNPTTKIKFDIVSNVKREMSNAKLVVYDLLGREVATPVNETLQPGTYEIEWDASNFASGIYFYKLVVSGVESSTGDFTQTRKMVLMK